MRTAVRIAVWLLPATLLLRVCVGAFALSPAPDIHTVLFAFNSAHIDAAGRKIIEGVVSKARANSGGIDDAVISPTGHADRAGSEDYNLALSLRRAEAVRDALIAAGIPADAITVARRGEDEPAVPTPDGVQEQANRRVEIVVQ
jgi:OOP family OmpA-OmpF porin